MMLLTKREADRQSYGFGWQATILPLLGFAVGMGLFLAGREAWAWTGLGLVVLYYFVVAIPRRVRRELDENRKMEGSMPGETRSEGTATTEE